MSSFEKTAGYRHGNIHLQHTDIRSLHVTKRNIGYPGNIAGVADAVDVNERLIVRGTRALSLRFVFAGVAVDIGHGTAPVLTISPVAPNAQEMDLVADLSLRCNVTKWTDSILP